MTTLQRIAVVFCVAIVAAVVGAILAAKTAFEEGYATRHAVSPPAAALSATPARAPAGPSRWRPPDDISVEVTQKGTPAFDLMARLKKERLWRALIIDFNRLNKSDSDEMSLVLSDAWYELSQGQRRAAAQDIAFLWAAADAEEQGNPSKCHVVLWTQDHEIAAHNLGGEVVLKDLKHGHR